MSTYGVGAPVHLTTEVRDSTGVLVNPASIQLLVLLPDGTTAGPLAPVNSGVGAYYYDFPTTLAGRHVARWVTATPTANTEQPFDVAAEWAAAAIVTLAETKAHLNITSSADDAELVGFMMAATAAVERHTGALLRRTYVEDVPGNSRALLLGHAPVLSVTQIDALGPGTSSYTAAELLVDGPAGLVTRANGGGILGPVRVTYVAGRTDLPPNVRLATLIIIGHLWETQRGTAVPRFGADEGWDPRAGYAIPRRALELLGEQISGIA